MKRFSKKSHESVKAMHQQKRSMRYYVWIYFIIFTVLILALLWIFQYFFLQNYYQSAKTRDMRVAAGQIQAHAQDSDLDNIARVMAFNNGISIKIVDEMGTSYLSENNMGSFSLLASDRFGMAQFELINELNNSGKDYFSEIIENEHFKAKEIVYITTLDMGTDTDCYLIMESSIEMLDSTASIIREQLIYITIILFELAFIVTIFISKRLSKPIMDITETAKLFGDGDYSVEFNGQGYLEIEELSTVLNNARTEISKVANLRKDLIANISHDLRTPLTMVKAYAEMIRDLSGDNPVKRQEHIQVIIDEADRLSGLVSNILEVSKLESGNMELDIKNISVVEKMNEVLQRYQVLIERDGYDIKYIADEDRTIAADPEKLDQVLYNFINNAVNYCGEDKVICIKQINKTDVVRFEISDNGKGIAKDLLPLIFDRYYRDKKVEREVVGTGLGLSICKAILKQHNYAFGVQSVEGKGSTFWFEAAIVKDTIYKENVDKKNTEIIDAKFSNDE